MTKIAILTRISAWLAVLAIIVLSVVPGNMRPDVLGNDHAEHFAAYFVAGSLFAAGYQVPVLSGVFLTICAGSLELVQLWIPGRAATAGDFTASTIGAWVGLLAIVVVRRAHERMFVAS